MKPQFRLGIIIFLFFHSLSCLGQSNDSLVSSPKKNAIFTEILSGPEFYSLNYQRIAFTTRQRKVSFTYKVGGTYLRSYQSVTFHSGIVVGKPNRSFEALMGVGYLTVDYSKTNRLYVEGFSLDPRTVFIAPQLGYRSQKLSNGFLFRATLMPWFTISPTVGRLRHTPGFGVSIGKAF